MCCVWHDLCGFVRNKQPNRAILYIAIYEGDDCIVFTIFILIISPTTYGVSIYSHRDFCHVGVSIN